MLLSSPGAWNVGRAWPAHSDAPAMHPAAQRPRLPASRAHLGLGAPALLPLAAAGQVAPPLLARRPLAVDVVVVQEVPGAAAELPLGAVGLAGARRLRREGRLSRGLPPPGPPRPISPHPRERARFIRSPGTTRPRRSWAARVLGSQDTYPPAATVSHVLATAKPRFPSQLANEH